MIYLTAFWVFFFIIFGVYSIARGFDWIRSQQWYDRYGILLAMLLLVLAIMAIVTRDPIPFLEAIPMEYQWFASLLAAGFGTWKLYLNPLKMKVYGMDRELGEVKSTVRKVDRDVGMLVQHILGKKGPDPRGHSP